jgi:exopolyphosphatase/guanosine-5'-triphosphate,3'-diphosphate pyrophosphatase
MPTFAAVDIGSNSVRLKISRLVSHRLVEVLEDREVTRLGESVFRNGFLSPEAIALTVKVLRRFHRAAQRAGADSVRVVATSALRDARNSRAFLEWVRSATGWQVEIISGLEEARLIHLASPPASGNSSSLAGWTSGGSCELTVSKKGHIQETVLPWARCGTTICAPRSARGDVANARPELAREIARWRAHHQGTAESQIATGHGRGAGHCLPYSITRSQRG